MVCPCILYLYMHSELPYCIFPSPLQCFLSGHISFVFDVAQHLLLLFAHIFLLELPVVSVLLQSCTLSLMCCLTPGNLLCCW